MAPPPRPNSLLVDARELTAGRITGIGRMLIGLVASLSESPSVGHVTLALCDPGAVPDRLRGNDRVSSLAIPPSFLRAEKTLSHMTRGGYAAFISPYRKLPLFGCHCPSVHTLHDVLDLTNPLYRWSLKTLLDIHRLRQALRRADLTWYDSRWSLQETERLVKTSGGNPRVRPLGVDERFTETAGPVDLAVLEKYGLRPGAYVLVVGNGLPHKNLGTLLAISGRMSRGLVCAGVSKRNQGYWEERYPGHQARWIEHLGDRDIPALLRHAFCLAQPSLAEGYGYPPLEAMASGTPAVVSAIEVLTETTGGHALIAATRDGASWLEAFIRLENKNLYQEQRRRGLAWVAKLKGRSGWQGHVADVEELLGSHR